MAHKYDVYAFGMVCPSRLLILKDPWPRPDGYAEIRTSYDTIGGEAANCAIAMARLGITVKLDGNWLPANNAGQSALRLLEHYRVDTSRIRQKRSQGLEEFVIAAGPSRTIFGRYGTSLTGGQCWNDPSISDLKQSRVACIDPFLKRASRLASQQAVRAGVPYTTVDALPNDPVIQDAAVVIISGEFRKRFGKRVGLEESLRRYQNNCQGLVVFTDGNRRIVYGRRRGPLKRYSPPAIKALDTSGAGDSFRAGMTYSLLMGWDDDVAVRFAATLAALNCFRFPGVLNSPTIAEVRAFQDKISAQ